MSQGNSTVFTDGQSQGSSRHLNLSPYDFIMFVGKRFYGVAVCSMCVCVFISFISHFFVSTFYPVLYMYM